MPAAVKAFFAMSLDGFIAGPRHELDWLQCVEMPDEDYGYQLFMSEIDTIVMGRISYEKILSFGGEFPFTGKTVYVIASGEPATPPPPGVMFRKEDPSALIRQLKHGSATGIYADGGKVIQSLLRTGDLDELIVSIIPVILGTGIPVYTESLKTTGLTLQDSRSYPSGLVQLRYRLS